MTTPKPPPAPQSAASRNFITVVSGLPRSGTSMVMQMLTAGGMPILTDGLRAADDDNPRGYLEWERVKALKHDTSWVPQARGKVVKVIYYWLTDLPAGESYRVIFLRRDLDEVLSSQSAMLVRRGGTRPTPAEDERMKRLFAEELRETEAWLMRQKQFTVLYVDYADAVRDPVAVAATIDDFLGGGLECGRMARAVSQELYRRRTI